MSAPRRVAIKLGRPGPGWCAGGVGSDDLMAGPQVAVRFRTSRSACTSEEPADRTYPGQNAGAPRPGRSTAPAPTTTAIKESHGPSDVEQAAARLGTTDRFIGRLRTERRIAVVKLGKHIRSDSDNLDAYILASRQEADTSVAPTRR